MIPGALLAAGATALLLTGFALVSVDGLWRPDAFDYAQIGRELASGRGFSSRHAIYALHLEFLKQGGLLVADWPNLHRFPLPSLAMAAGFRVFGAGDAVVVGYGIVFQAATAGLLFAWARAALGVAPAVACVALFAGNGTLLETGASGLSEPPVLFFFTLALYAVWRQREARGAAPCLWAGAALGLAALARTNVLSAAPLLLVALIWGRDKRTALRLAAGFTAALVAVSSPWWLRNALVAGDPFFSLHSYFLLPSGTGPGNLKWDLSVPWVREFVSPLAFFAEHPGPVLEKWWGNLTRLLRALPGLGGTFGVPLVAALALGLPVSGGLRPAARLLFTCFALNALLVSFSDFYLLKYHVHFLPGLMLLAVACVWHGVSRAPGAWLRGLVLGVAVLVLADLGSTARAFRRVPASIARYDRAHFERVRAETVKDAIVLSDQSHAVAWETGRRSVRVHYDRDADGKLMLGVSTLQASYLPIDAIYLSRQFLRDPGKLAALNRTIERDARFRRDFREMIRLEGGGVLFLHRSPES